MDETNQSAKCDRANPGDDANENRDQGKAEQADGLPEL
jgi:hypothetical protein